MARVWIQTIARPAEYALSPRPRIRHTGGVKTRIERSDNQIVRRIDVYSIIEPSDHPSESDGGVQCLWVRDVSKDPRHTSYVTLVCSTNGVKVLGLQPWCRLMDVYVLERDHRKRLAAEERPDSPVPHPMGPQKCLFRLNDRGDDSAPDLLPRLAKSS